MNVKDPYLRDLAARLGEMPLPVVSNGRQRRCPEVSTTGRRCAMSVGADHHRLQRTTTGLGLPRLIHEDADGVTWLAPKQPEGATA